MNQFLRTPGDVGAMIRTRRRALGWDQAELAAKIGASRLWVNEIERGKPGAGLGLVLKAFSALGLALLVRADGDDAPSTDEPARVQPSHILEILRAAKKKPS